MVQFTVRLMCVQGSGATTASPGFCALLGGGCGGCTLQNRSKLDPEYICIIKKCYAV